MTDQSPIDDRALDSLSVAPEAGNAGGSKDPRQDAGQDRSIEKRLQKHPDSADAKVDQGLDESMDASDPVSATQPGRNDPAPSSGYDEAEEAERQRDA
ncbi:MULTISPECIES: hypothetical protein [unclassified Sphingomonas]|jgi:hypothetical protein|uniref:hypothetical protein n=1 Tax=unclassified Sphingomonas TaxID=196159 RepID=UPI00160A85B1|nr:MULTISPECIES: hypothetical protein [unclassified Sphingomonas]MBB3346821.1 hypothetical protein [Sphingomonas sp. BK069]MBB3472799.1 hypothetical protein [Sphingomonas sp. BK345]MBB3692144.1 hypothetical protein [Sphingomonas sp. BK580]